MKILLQQHQQILSAGLSQVGGKAWQLAQLADYGLPVPACVVIPASQQQRWLQHSGLLAQLQAAAEQIVTTDQPLLAAQQRLLAQPLPDELVSEITLLLQQRNWGALAVRSSASAEDSGQFAFAGIHLTRLNVIGLEAVLQAVREVWASSWSPAAAAYRHKMGLGQQASAMAVVLMPLLPAVASGIAFSCDPRNGRDDQLVLHANWGLGESLVGGLAEGDEVLLQDTLQGLQLLHYQIGSKQQHTVTSANGTQQQPTSTAQAQQAVLSSDQALQLGRYLQYCADALNFAEPYVDMEWVWDGRQFWIVQARPITRRPHYTYPALQQQADIWSRGNTCEVVPLPMLAMDWFCSRRLVNNMLEPGHQHAGYPLLPGAQRARLYQGRLYLNVALLQWECYDAFGIKPAAFNDLMGGHQPEITTPTPSLRDHSQRGLRLLRYIRASNRVRRSAEQILQRARDNAREWRALPLDVALPDLQQRMWQQLYTVGNNPDLCFLQGSSGAGVHHLIQLLNRYLPNQGHALAAGLLAGGEASVTAQQAYDLAELAQQVRRDAELTRWIQQPQRQLQQLPESHPFRSAFAQFIEQYGHRAVYESYFQHPRWRETPDFLLDNIAGLLQRDLSQLRQQQQQASQQARQTAFAALPFYLRPLCRLMINNTKRESNHREAARSGLVALMEPLRYTLLAIARHWSAVLADANDIFHLTPREISATISGELPLSSLVPRINSRKQQLQNWQQLSPPDVFCDHSGQVHTPPTASLSSNQDGYQGIPIGTGCAQGVARILYSPEQSQQLQAGDILVAPATDPSWTPLFLKAGGLIVETGGHLSHSAIVAREFGIPAVVNLPGILGKIRDGDKVEVDGMSGRVRVLSSGE